MVEKLLVDVDPETCVMCGMCEEVCPTSAIQLTIDGERENPVLVHGAFPELVHSVTFNGDKFDWDRKDFVIENCPPRAISYDEEQHMMVIDEDLCVYCCQCEVAAKGAFEVVQPWSGTVELRREKCVAGCLACVDVCPTRALYVGEDGDLVLADYFCMKCGACMQVCPVKPEVEEYEDEIEAYGVTKTFAHHRVLNQKEMPIWVERWRAPQSGAERRVAGSVAKDGRRPGGDG